MSQSSLHATAFYQEVCESAKLWTIRDKGGFPQPVNADGVRAQPFWSSLNRVEKIIRDVPAYAGFEPYELSWKDFSERWVPGMTKDRVLVGLNWSGEKATGYDVEPEQVKRNVEHFITAS